MGAGCSRECHAAIREAEAANRRVNNVQRQLQENFVQSRKIQERLERQYNDMVGTANARFDSYRSRLDHVTREKENVERDYHRLQLELADVQKEHSKVVCKMQRMFSKTIRQKDEMMKETLTAMFQKFSALLTQERERNEHQVNLLMEEIERKDEIIAELIERVEKLVEKLEERNSSAREVEDEVEDENDFEIVDGDGDDEFGIVFGAELMRMVNESRNGIIARSELEVGQNSMARISAALFAIDFIASNPDSPTITITVV